jgi:hypothetical protein
MVHTFVLARLATFVILAPPPLVAGDTFWTKALRWPVVNFIYGHAVSCFVPVLIWAAVTMRREDGRRLAGSTQKKVTA